ncbi:hypothetical protein AB1Y20_011493 [Prymnesium parvum]|uniref:Uncharacterized protein n=1 Tax=Prymnesium parvum TaxID=97485 RepID=A0AB34IGJ2_PRYPA
MPSFFESLDRHFGVSARGSTLPTELRAGMTTFMTMAYILVVNPTVLSSAGLPFQPVALATALAAVLGSGFVGLAANLPFGLAPGMGLNAYFAYGVCVAKGIKYGAALAVVFLMGLAFSLLSALGACAYLQKVMPSNLKHATTVAIGIFQAFIGFRMINFVVADEHTLVTAGDITSAEVVLGMLTTLLIGALVAHRVQGAMLLGIGVSSCVSWTLGFARFPQKLVEMPTLHVFWHEFEWGEVVDQWRELLPVLLALLFVCIFDTAGVQFGAGMQADLLDKQTGTLPGSKPAFLAASLATTFGSLLGTSPTIIHNETCAGIAEGGRTGLTALVVAAMFSLSVFFVPVFAAVPTTATAPALIVVGAFMMGPAGAMDWDNFKESLPAFLTISVMPLTYSIANGVVAGLVTYTVLELLVDPLAFLRCRSADSPLLAAPLHPKAGGEKLASLASSAASSPHAMVRDPTDKRTGSFGGLAALGGLSPSVSPQVTTTWTVSGGAYQAPSVYPTL